MCIPSIQCHGHAPNLINPEQATLTTKAESIKAKGQNIYRLPISLTLIHIKLPTCASIKHTRIPFCSLIFILQQGLSGTTISYIANLSYYSIKHNLGLHFFSLVFVLQYGVQMEQPLYLIYSNAIKRCLPLSIYDARRTAPRQTERHRHEYQFYGKWGNMYSFGGDPFYKSPLTVSNVLQP